MKSRSGFEMGKAVTVGLLVLTVLMPLQACGGPDPKGLYLIALMGQSNMSGRGDLSDLPANFPENPTNIWNFSNAYKWELAKEPIDSTEGQVDKVSEDRKGKEGVGPGLALADAFVSAHPSVSVGLIPCARGATRISQWLKT